MGGSSDDSGDVPRNITADEVAAAHAELASHYMRHLGKTAAQADAAATEAMAAIFAAAHGLRNMIGRWITGWPGKFVKPALASILLLTNAACQAEAGKTYSSAASADPGYGGTVPIRGLYVVGEETSVLRACYGRPAQCAAASEQDQQECWVRFTARARQSLSGKIDGQDPGGGRFWLEGAGRLATRPGRFGHLGAYACQIEIGRIEVFDALPAEN